MGRTEYEKTKLILHWFKKSTQKASDEKKILILTKWIDICSNEEEFRIAETLKRELDKIRDDKLAGRLGWMCFLRVKLSNIFIKFKELWIGK